MTIEDWSLVSHARPDEINKILDEARKRLERLPSKKSGNLSAPYMEVGVFHHMTSDGAEVGHYNDCVTCQSENAGLFSAVHIVHCKGQLISVYVVHRNSSGMATCKYCITEQDIRRHNSGTRELHPLNLLVAVKQAVKMPVQ